MHYEGIFIHLRCLTQKHACAIFHRHKQNQCRSSYDVVHIR